MAELARRRSGLTGTAVRRCLAAVLVAAFAVTCLRLGWWQWERFQSHGGSAQNLGYTLQWPTFAAFAIFMWWRLTKLEARRRAERAEQAEHAEQPVVTTATVAATRPAVVTGSEQRAVPVEHDEPDEPDDELAAYNRYLATLATLDAREQHSAS